MLHEDLEDLLKNKVEKLYEDMIKRRIELNKRRVLIEAMKGGSSGETHLTTMESNIP